MKKEKLKIVDFKNIPSSLKNFKEIVVTYNEDGELKRYYAFVDKNEKNPINAAKKEFDAAIKRGNAFKKDKIQSPSTKKNPFMVATLGIVSALALTMTGLFVWKAVTVAPSGGGGGDTPEPVPPEPIPDEPGDPSKPLTFVCLEDSGQIDFIYERYISEDAPPGTSIPPRDINLEYQINGGDWIKAGDVKQYSTDTQVTIVKNLKIGDEVCLRGDNDYWSYVDSEDWDADETLSLTTVGRFSVENNIMSLVDKDDFEHTVNTSVGCFVDAFSPTYIPDGDTVSDLYDASKLVLPKIDLLPAYYYYEMFYMCHELRFAPQEIMSETGSIGFSSCYCMFQECISLLTAPNRVGSAEGSIDEAGCSYMFQNCINLAVAPELPSTNFVAGIGVEPPYLNMFESCNLLYYIKVGFGANGWPESVTDNWLSNISGPSFLYASPEFCWKGEDDPNRTIVDEDESHIPGNWVVHHYE